MRKTILAIVFIAVSATAQTVHSVPFGGSGNAIEIAVANNGLLPLSGVTVTAEKVPEWMTMSDRHVGLGAIPGRSERAATFSFAVDRTAPVGVEHVLEFQVLSAEGISQFRTIALRVSAPEKAELFRNYPNPFNPTTTIGFELPANGNAQLQIFDVLGRQVAILADDDQTAGYHQYVFDASRLAGGMYIARLTYQRQDGTRGSLYRSMILMK